MSAALAAGQATETEVLDVLPSKLDAGVGYRAAIGLLVLASDQTMEHEFRRVLSLDGVAVYQSRIFNDNAITPDSLRAMGERIAAATALILPSVPLDVVAYGCTSASMELGEEVVFDEIRKARPGIKCTTPVTAALAALGAFGVTRVGVVTPYDAAVNRIVASYLKSRGVTVPAIATFNRQDDREAARISLESIEEAAVTMARRVDVEAVFVSCTNLRLVDRAAAIEARIGMPVTSSNHALIWHCLRLAGIDDALTGLGSLYELGLAD